MKKRNGFTLIELIVVIAILAILALLAVPSYNGLKEKAKHARYGQYVQYFETAQKIYESDFVGNDLIKNAADSRFSYPYIGNGSGAPYERGVVDKFNEYELGEDLNVLIDSIVSLRRSGINCYVYAFRVFDSPMETSDKNNISRGTKIIGINYEGKPKVFFGDEIKTELGFDYGDKVNIRNGKIRDIINNME